MVSKKEIRKHILGLRKKLSQKEIEFNSRRITEKVVSHPEYLKAELVLCYMDAKGEVQTQDIIQDAWEKGKKVAVPRVTGSEMYFYEITSFSQLEKGYFGILEPDESCPIVEPSTYRTVVMMPGVAFDEDCNRIGYGGGFYDKYFSKYPEVYKIALAHKIQMVPKIQAEEFDLKPDCIITEHTPNQVFHFFEEICKIPHGTENTKKLSDYCVEFAKVRGLKAIQDHVGNVVISKPGTEGYEDSEPIILQGHMDMVCEKTLESNHDFLNDPIELYMEDGYVKAKDTTLGGDNGIAIAYGLALLDSKEIEHPPIEVLFTVDEETTMIGAEEIDMSLLKGKKMINLDSEAEGVFTVGCAGGLGVIIRIPFCVHEAEKEIISIHIKGLMGGHSGSEIHHQRGNANKLMGRLLHHLMIKGFQFDLASINGGEKDSVITNNCVAEIGVTDESSIIKEIRKIEEIWKKELGKAEPNLQVDVATLPRKNVKVLIAEDTRKIIRFLAAMPDGILGYERELAGQVETSLNVGVVKTEENSLFLNYLIRSSIDTKRNQIGEELFAYTTLAGGSMEIDCKFPAWSYNPGSKLLPVMAEVYENMYGEPPVIETIHAGLECGVFAGKCPDIDCVSIGPNIFDVHSVSESMEIASVERTWEFLKAVLKECK